MITFDDLLVVKEKDEDSVDEYGSSCNRLTKKGQSQILGL